DTGSIKRLYCTLCHTVVLSVDNVEVATSSDGSFNYLACFFEAAAVTTGTVSYNVELAGIARLENSVASSNFSCGTELTANEDNVVSRQVLAQEPVNSGLSFSVHVGNECCLVVRSIGLDESVKQEDSYT